MQRRRKPCPTVESLLHAQEEEEWPRARRMQNQVEPSMQAKRKPREAGGRGKQQTIT